MNKLADISSFESLTNNTGYSVFNFGGGLEGVHFDPRRMEEYRRRYVDDPREEQRRAAEEFADELADLVETTPEDEATTNWVSKIVEDELTKKRGGTFNNRRTPTLNEINKNKKMIHTKNAINLTKKPAGGGIDLTKSPAGGGIYLSKDNLRPYFGMIADGIGGLLARGVTPNSIFRYCQQRISQSTQFDQQRAQQMGKNMSGSVMGMLKQHARAVPVQ